MRRIWEAEYWFSIAGHSSVGAAPSRCQEKGPCSGALCCINAQGHLGCARRYLSGSARITSTRNPSENAGRRVLVFNRSDPPVLTAPREGDTLVVWKLDRLGRSLRHLVNVVHDLTSRGVGLKVLTGQGAAIDTTTPAGKLVFGIFASLAEFERALISERTRAGLASARARGRKGGRRPKMTPAKLRLAMSAMGNPETNVGDLCRELGVTRSTLYRHVSPTGERRVEANRP
jgi:hypothetical protein